MSRSEVDKARVLYVTTYDPLASSKGGAAWVDTRIIEKLSASLLVDTLIVCESGVRDPVPLEVRTSLFLTFRTVLRMIFLREPYQAAKFRMSPHWKKRVAELGRVARGYDSIVTSQWPAALLAYDASVRADAHIGHNVDTALAERHDPKLFRLIKNSQRMQALERGVLAGSSSRWMLSASDARRIQAWGISAAHLPLGAGVETCVRTKHRALGFLGKGSWPPNTAAINVLVDEVLPRVRRELGSCAPSLLLAGSDTDRWSSKPGVNVLGKVEDVEDFYSRVDLVVVPRLGMVSGISVKMMEALEHGVPVVVPESLANDAGLGSGYICANTIDETVEMTLKYYSGDRSVAESSIERSSQRSTARHEFDRLTAMLGNRSREVGGNA